MASSSIKSASAAVITSFAYNPLTTRYSRPADCNGIYMSGYLGMIDVSTTCLPSGFNKAASSYFSPGVACPLGYYRACHDTTGVSSITTVTCCPVYNQDISLSCVTTSTLSSVWASLYCTWSPESGHPTSLPVTLSANGITSTSMMGVTKPGGVNAFGIRMVYESTDVITATSGATSTAQTPSATSSRATSSSTSSSRSSTQAASSSSSTPTAGSTNTGLSTGAIVGIAVGAALAVLILVGALFLWRRKKRSSRHVHAPVAQTDTKDYPQEDKPQVHEAMSSQPAELSSGNYQDHVPTESGKQPRPVELPGS